MAHYPPPYTVNPQIATTIYCTRQNIPGISQAFSQMLRVRRICTKTGDFLINALMLTSHFIRRGYPTHLIITALKRALKLNRDDLLNKKHLTRSMPKESDTSKTFYCITTHKPLNPPIAERIKRNWELLERTKSTRCIMDAKLVFGLRRNKNLSNQVVRASTSSKSNTRMKHKTKNPGYYLTVDTASI